MMMQGSIMIKRSIQPLFQNIYKASTRKLLSNSFSGTARSYASTTSKNNDGIVSIALNNPCQRNALSTTVMESLQKQLASAKADPTTRVIVIKAVNDAAYNDGVFSAGHDLKELTQSKGESKEEYQGRMQKLFSLCNDVMIEVSTFPVPTIAQVHGVATAAGCQLVASCDLAVATSTSRFATPGVRIGLFCSTPAVPLVRNVSKKHAMELLLTGDMISAQRAYEMGLINRVTEIPEKELRNLDDDPQEQRRLMAVILEKEVQKLAKSIAKKSKKTIQIGLKTLRAQQLLPLEDAYAIAGQSMVENLLSYDAAEGISAFLEKRNPEWEEDKKVGSH